MEPIADPVVPDHTGYLSKPPQLAIVQSCLGNNSTDEIIVIRIHWHFCAMRYKTWEPDNSRKPQNTQKKMCFVCFALAQK